MTLIATVTVCLSAASPNPKRMSFQMACGTAIGAFVGFFETFFVFPWIDGFPLLCMVLAPVFAWLWPKLDKHGLNPSLPAKFGWALVFLGLAAWVAIRGMGT